jgi:regulation of enolase protein 1 (concanavalin A-like superfamily)
VDGNSATRWSSVFADNQWIYMDLGSTKTISRVKFFWEVYASGYKIQVSNDAATWTDIYTTTTEDGAIDDVAGLSGSGRYVRVLCVTRGTPFGISLWDFEVYGPNGLLTPWINQDIGLVGVTGTASYASGTFSLNGSGGDINSKTDTCHFVYQPASGDCTITARVTSQSNTHAAAQACVMIRESLAPNSANANMKVSSSLGVMYGYRLATNAISGSSGWVLPGAAPYWVRVKRVGNTFTGYKSTDNITWTQVGAVQTIPMGTNVYIGLAECSHANTVLGTATFDNVTAVP